jgi:hypothetical protein
MVNSSMPKGGVSRPELHADQEHHAEPHRVDAELLHQRHEDRQRDQHHADLVDEDAQQDQHQHHAGDHASMRRQALSGDHADQIPLLAPRTRGSALNVVAPTMMNRIMPEIAAVPRSALAGARHGQRAVGQATATVAKRAHRRRLGGGRPAGGHRATTSTKIDTSGSTYCHEGPQRAQPV